MAGDRGKCPRHHVKAYYYCYCYYVAIAISQHMLSVSVSVSVSVSIGLYFPELPRSAQSRLRSRAQTHSCAEGKPAPLFLII